MLAKGGIGPGVGIALANIYLRLTDSARTDELAADAVAAKTQAERPTNVVDLSVALERVRAHRAAAALEAATPDGDGEAMHDRPPRNGRTRRCGCPPWRRIDRQRCSRRWSRSPGGV
jgi:hypothetical protein